MITREQAEQVFMERIAPSYSVIRKVVYTQRDDISDTFYHMHDDDTLTGMIELQPPLWEVAFEALHVTVGWELHMYYIVEPKPSIHVLGY